MKLITQISLLILSATSFSLAEQTTNPKHKVLIIGIDGMRPDQMQTAKTPHIDVLMTKGASSMTATNCWTAEDAFIGHSAPNWATLLTGLTPKDHQITKNGDKIHLIDDGDANKQPGSKIKTLFGYAKSARPDLQTAVFNTWGGIGTAPGTILEFSTMVLDRHYAAPNPKSSATRDILNTRAAVHAIGGLAAAQVKLPHASFSIPDFKNFDPDLVFVHLDDVDHAGHEYGYRAPKYRAAIERSDTLVGELIAAVKARPSYAKENWLIILTTDHGGQDEGGQHKDNTDIKVHTIPLILSGKSVTKFDPSKPISLYDVTPTTLAHLGIDPKTLNLTGRPLVPVSKTKLKSR